MISAVSVSTIGFIFQRWNESKPKDVRFGTRKKSEFRDFGTTRDDNRQVGLTNQFRATRAPQLNQSLASETTVGKFQECIYNEIYLVKFKVRHCPNRSRVRIRHSIYKTNESWRSRQLGAAREAVEHQPWCQTHLTFIQRLNVQCLPKQDLGICQVRDSHQS